MLKLFRSSVCASAAAQQLRHAHIQVPDFSKYRRQNSGVVEGDYATRAFTYVLAGGVGVVGAHTAKHIVQDFLDTMSTSADVKALAELEVELDNIPEGKNMTFKWQGKPLFVRHRTAEEIEAMQNTDISKLPDPQTDADRVEKGREQWLVLLGICTHLGCVPLSHSGDFNGYFCPCHGSHYDASGRIRKGPAPLNLARPPYKFTSDSMLIVG